MVPNLTENTFLSTLFGNLNDTGEVSKMVCTVQISMNIVFVEKYYIFFPIFDGIILRNMFENVWLYTKIQEINSNA